jgi:AraC family transcriptional regulator of arabinose operon
LPDASISDKIIFVSYSIHGHINRGAYDQPFSGVGIEFDPLGVKPGRTGITLHEAGYLPDNNQWNFPAVFSPFWRFYYNASPGHFVMFGERTIELTPDRLVIIPPHHIFHCQGDKAARNFWLAFSFSRKLSLDHQIPVLLKPRDTELCLIRDLQDLILANHRWQPTDAIFRNSLALLQVMLSRPELHWQPPIPENFERVRVHIENALAAGLTAPVLARQAGLSIAGFNRGFRRYFGTSPAHYVMQMRIREAARLLLQTDATIDSVAEETGFPNRAYFSRVFKRVTDEAPAGFRRRHRLVAASR